MATIQIRDVPEGVHATYRARAALAGMSLQEYLRKELEAGALLKNPAEIAAEVRRDRRVQGEAGFSDTSSADLIRSDRQAR